MLQIITIICVTHVQKIFWIRASIKKLLTKYQIFMILPQISHFHKFRNFSSIFATFETNCFIPINFYGRDMSGILFFIFASCHPLRTPVQLMLHFWTIHARRSRTERQTSVSLKCDTRRKRVKSRTFLHRIQLVPNKYFWNFTRKTCIHSISFDFR